MKLTTEKVTPHNHPFLLRSFFSGGKQTLTRLGVTVFSVLVLLAPLVFLTPIHQVQADTFLVNCGDEADFIADMQSAEATGQSDTIILNADNVADCVYTFNAHFPEGLANGLNALPSVNTKITIEGNGAKLERPQGLGTSFRFFYVHRLGSLTLNDITLENGATSTKGGGIRNNGILTMTLTNILSSTAGVYGGGIYNEQFGSATIVSSTISYNTAEEQFGGGITNRSEANMTIEDSVISHNFAEGTRGHIDDGNGGAMFIGRTGHTRIINSIISHNRGTRNGGGLFIVKNDQITERVHLTIVDSQITYNEAYTQGGGIYSMGIMTITNSSISNNDSIGEFSQGGGIFSTFKTSIHMTNSSVQTNTAVIDGGGIFLEDSSTATIIDSAISDNILTGEIISGSKKTAGAGIQMDPKAEVLLNGSLLSGNTIRSLGNGEARGGAVMLKTNSVLTAVNTTFSGNIAEPVAGNSIRSKGRGGAIHSDGGIVNLNNVTVTKNESLSDDTNVGQGGAFFFDGGSFTIKNSIIADNTADEGVDLFSKGGSTYTSDDYNIIGVNDGFYAITGGTNDQVGTPGTLIAPLLEPLADNGGETQTHALQQGSPARDMGNPAVPGSGGDACENVDQRGEVRPTVLGNRCDIGAYEADSRPTVYIQADNSGVVTEGDAGSLSATFTVSITNAISDAVTINYDTIAGTATADVDFTASTGQQVVIPAGDTTGTIQVDVTGDLLDELDETFEVMLTAATNGIIQDAPNNAATMTIADNDQSQISINDVAITEEDVTTTATFTISLDIPSDRTITVTYQTENDTAMAGTDFVSKSETISFAPTETEVGVSIDILGGTANEETESFNVILSNPQVGTIADGTGLGTITDNDPQPDLAINDVTIMESVSPAEFTVSLSAVSDLIISVDYATGDDTAEAGSDYEATSGTLIFNPGELTKTVAVSITDNNLDEFDETFNIQLSAATNAGITVGTGVGIIVDDEDPPAVSISDDTVAENAGTINFNITLSEASSLPISVTVTSSDTSATAGSDYTAIGPEVVTFMPGETSQSISTAVNDDGLVESTETFSVTLSNPINATIDDGVGAGTLLDVDTAGVHLVESDGSTLVDENGASDTFELILTGGPAVDVTVTVTPDDQVDLGAGAGTAIDIVFTPANWMEAQTVTVMAIDDNIAEGIHSSLISHIVSSGDTNFDGLTIDDVTVSIEDNDNAVLTITESDGNTSGTEDGATDTYEIALTSQPTDTVTVTITPDAQTDLGNGAGTAIVHTFTSQNWDTPQQITVSVIDDEVAEGNHQSTINHTLTSNDPNYNFVGATVTVDITDNDTANIIITESNGSTTANEGGVPDTYEFVLTSQPMADVIITITPDAQLDLGNGAGLSINLTFTDANWNIPQVVSVSAIQDNVAEGDHSGQITYNVSSTDATYGAFTIPSLTVPITEEAESPFTNFLYLPAVQR
ncbi:MAG: Calx-beta domain-containing protein [Chloroflexota bacterium]